MGVVSTIQGKCKRCYACVRNCPAKAIRVHQGQAQVIEERCIACGTCLRVCSQKAKQIESGVEPALELIRNHRSVIAILAPSFPAAFPKIKPGQMVTALKKLGFSEVMEVAFGAQMVSRAYARLAKADGGKPIITTPCPALILYVEKHCPELIPYLAPIVSPMIALGRAIKWKYDPEARVVFIGPCIAKKQEARDEKVAGIIEAVITYAGLDRMFKDKGIDPAALEESPLSGPKPHLARAFPISGGLLKAAALSGDVLDSEIVVTEGKDRVIEILREVARGEVKAKFLDLLFCEGCINGPVMENDLTVPVRKDIIVDYLMKNADPERAERDLKAYSDIDVSRGFTDRSVHLSIPTEEEIKEILRQINKTKPEDELNCGACGYNSCREKAIAVYQGLAENEMCLHYLVETLISTRDQLIQAEKLTSLGQMAASIAHEINNPLAGVLVYTKLLAKKVSADRVPREDALGYLGKMETEITRSSRIIRNLLDFARQSEPRLVELQLNKVIEQALSIVGHQAEIQKIQVVRELEPDLPTVVADFDQLQQVFINLILNGIQAMPKGGKLTVRTSAVTESKGPDKAKWLIRADVQDTGCGIPKENLRRLFTPFFTTKEKGKGVGLGLAVVYGIIQRHKGKIEVDSEVDKGTTFSIYLGGGHEQAS